MDTGRLRNKVSFYSFSATDDGMGGGAASWTLYGERWANVKRPNGSRELQYDELAKIKEYIITVRYDSGINDTMQIRYGGVKLTIARIDPDDEDSRFMVIKAYSK